MTVKKPTLLYDGDCAFCQYCVDYLTQITKEQVTYQAYQHGTLGVPQKDCQKSIQLVVSDTKHYQGAAAGFKTLSYGQSNRGWWLYKHLPGFAWITEKIYEKITHHRNLTYSVAKVICGNPWQPGRLTFLAWASIALLAALILAL